MNGWHIVFYLKMRCSLKKESEKMELSTTLTTMTFSRKSLVISGTHDRYVILDPSGRFVIMDHYCRFVTLDTSGQFVILDPSSQFLTGSQAADLWFWTLVPD